MIEVMDRVGIRPQERRSVILLLLGLLVVGNVVWMFMGPELLSLQGSLKDFEEKNAALADLPKLIKEVEKEVQTLETETGGVTDGRQAQKLMEEIESKARRSGLNFTRSRGQSGSSRKNQDFEEAKRTVSFQSGLIDLVEFLKNVSEGKSMIRVSNMTIMPTTDRKQLKVDLTFTASYPKPEVESKSKKSKKSKK
jgi:Tfp pilus assembly protein PilO